MLYKVRELTVFERKVFHFALWKWCSVHKKPKSKWPGWGLFNCRPTNSCFLCDSALSILCDDTYRPCIFDCLDGLYMKYLDSFERLKIQPNNNAYQINFRNICMEIAKVPFKEKFNNSPENQATIQRIKNDLKEVYKRK